VKNPEAGFFTGVKTLDAARERRDDRSSVGNVAGTFPTGAEIDGESDARLRLAASADSQESIGTKVGVDSGKQQCPLVVVWI
jgi:hypothetical protein